MSAPLSPEVSFETYERFVESTMQTTDESWRAEYASWIRDEDMEFLAQHGPGVFYLLSAELGTNATVIDAEFPELKTKMVDELGDMLWFGFAIASKFDIQVTAACAKSTETEPGDNTAEIIAAATSNADNIRVANKISILFPDADEAMKTTSLRENPFYVFQRTVARLCRAVDQSEFDIPPWTMTDLEPRADIQKALGDYLNVLFYVASESLGSDVATVIQTNIEKLQHRQLHGKQ